MKTTLQEPLLLLMQIKWTLTTDEDMHDTAHGVRLYRDVTWLDACNKDANEYLILFLGQLINYNNITCHFTQLENCPPMPGIPFCTGRLTGTDWLILNCEWHAI